MKITNWYRNGSAYAFQKFCIQNRNRPIFIKLINNSEFVKGLLHGYRFRPSEKAGVYILLTDTVIHPAFYPLEDIRSMHYLGLSISIQLDICPFLECPAC